MTMQQVPPPGQQGQGGKPPPFTPAPPPGYWTLQCSHATQLKANHDGLKQAGEEFVYQLSQGVEALIRPEPNTEKFLASCRAKPQELWAEQRAKFPDLGQWWDFRHLMERWLRAAPVDPQRDAVMAYIVDTEIQRELAGLTEGL
jgi:hypothetical protein